MLLLLLLQDLRGQKCLLDVLEHLSRLALRTPICRSAMFHWI